MCRIAGGVRQRFEELRFFSVRGSGLKGYTMKISCEKNELFECLQSTAAITGGGPTTKPILRNCLLVADGGGVRIEVTDLDVSARLHLERQEVDGKGKLTLPAARLLSLVREVPGNRVVIEAMEDGKGATICSEGGEYSFKLLGESADEFPEVRSFAGENAFELTAGKFSEMLRRVAVASSRDASRYQLTGVFCEIEGKNLKMTATDGKRLTTDEMEIENSGSKTISGIIPNRAADVMVKVLSQGSENIKLALEEIEVQMSFVGGELIAKLVEGTFPEYKSAIPSDVTTKVTADRGELVAAVRSASLVTDKETETVIFRFKGKEVELESKGSDIGESKIRVGVEMDGDGVEIRFNPTYFVDALRTIDTEQVRMEFYGPERPGAIIGEPNYRHYLMPLVVN
jgi:DNA polymerase-3 subunit beta